MNIILHTESNPEDNAMLQALYSRSAASVKDHLQKLAKTGSGKFMSSYYLGYGHGSIGDCGFVTTYFEGVSMLAAKAIEDNPLFNGQECSSRYIDFSKQLFVNPYLETIHWGDVEWLYSKYREFYVASLQPVKDSLKKRFSKPEGEEEVRYEKAISARAFDILRGFLPNSASTNVAWTTSLRKAQDILIGIAHHPLLEVRAMALKAFKMLQEKYPNSFKSQYAGCEDFSWGGIEKFLIDIEGLEVYNYLSNIHHFYSDVNGDSKTVRIASDEELVTVIDIPSAKLTDSGFLNTRLKYLPLPRHDLNLQDQWNINTFLDFGSFRDIQRHRNGYCSNPMVTCKYGFHPWYYNQLPESVKTNASNLLDNIEEMYQKAGALSPVVGQYLLPMGMLVNVDMKYSAGQAVYVAELRSGKTVHPTLRPFAQELGKKALEYGVPCYYDTDPGDWTLKRGDQDIVQKTQ